MKIFSLTGAWLPIPVLILVSASLQAQNLIVNPDFDTDVSGWFAETLSWIADDGGGPSGPGCAEISSDLNNGGVRHASSTRVPIVVNTEYFMSGWAKLDIESLAEDANLFADWYDSNGQYMGTSTFYGLKPDEWDGQWHEVTGTVTFPPGAVEATVHFGVTTPSEGVGESRARWDSMYFGLTPLIFSDGFEDD